MRNSARVAVVAFAFAAAADAEAQVYKWVDENGKVQYGDKPPEGAKAAPLGVAPAPSGTVAPAPQPDWKQKDLEFQRRKIERERNEGARAAQRDANRDAACSDTRRRLGVLEEKVPVYQRNEKGERVYIEDQERARMMDEYKRFLSETCR